MTNNNYLQDISDIKNMMSKSSRFMSLRGLSGILAGIYALAAAAYAHFRIAALPDYSGDSVVLNAVGNFMAAYDLVGDLFFVATLTLFLAIVTGALLTYRKAKKLNEKIWNPVSKRLLAHFGICRRLILSCSFAIRYRWARRSGYLDLLWSCTAQRQ